MLRNRMLRGATAEGVNFVSSSVNRVTTASNTVPAPSGIQDGQLLVAFAFITIEDRTLTLPAGWTQRQRFDQAAGGEATLIVATKVASSESGDYTFLWGTGSKENTIAVLVYKNAIDTDRLIGVEAGNGLSTIAAPSISPTQEGALLAFFGNTFGARVVDTPPVGMVERAIHTASFPSVVVYDLVPSEAGATGDKTLTWSSPSNNALSALQVQIYKG